MALAGWLWMRIRDGRPFFRRSDLLHVEGLDHFGGSDPGSRKAFERARDELGSFGIDIEWDDSVVNDADPKAPGGYRVSGLKLTAEQQQALVGLAFTIAYRDLATEEALRIPGSFLEGAGDALLLEPNHFVAPIAEAIDEHQCIRFLYKDEADQRDAQPIRLGYERGNWYLAAYEFAADKTKVFRLDRMHSLDHSDQEWSDSYDTEDARQAVTRARDRFFWGNGEIKQVVLAIDSESELSARRLLSDLDEIGVDSTDRLLMSRSYSNDDNMLDAVLTLGRRAEIIEPPDLRRAMIDRLSAMIGDSE
ncbi:MAG: WYL domain-containing protein [Actinomycetia bacterium]|nr:WYL domain-containing protein [Actinomycetes bacterium]